MYQNRVSLFERRIVMNLVKHFIQILIFAFVSFAFIGCGKQNIDSSTPIVSIILIGNHANSKCFDVRLDTTIQQTYSSFGNAGIIVIDGHPTLLRNDSLDSLSGIAGCYSADYLEASKKLFGKNNPIWQRDYLNPQKEDFMEQLNKCKADDPEVDILEALHIAVNSLNTIENSMGTNVQKEIIILDAGLCTSGTINFLNSQYLELLNYNSKLWEDAAMNNKISKLISQLEDQAELPNLDGIQITWYGLGQVCEPQPSLSKLQVQNLQYFWGELLTHAGASPSAKANADNVYNIFVSTNTNGTIKSSQYVTPIQWNITDDGKTYTMPNIPEQKIDFHPNTDEYLSPDKVPEILSPYISILQDYPNERLFLIGTTSSWKGGSLKLSEDRALRVKEQLIKLGFPENNIKTIGLGFDQRICQNDTPNGQFEETIATKNRSVWILPYESPKIQDILHPN